MINMIDQTVRLLSKNGIPKGLPLRYDENSSINLHVSSLNDFRQLSKSGIETLKELATHYEGVSVKEVKNAFSDAYQGIKGSLYAGDALGAFSLQGRKTIEKAADQLKDLVATLPEELKSDMRSLKNVMSLIEGQESSEANEDFSLFLDKAAKDSEVLEKILNSQIDRSLKSSGFKVLGPS